MAAVEGSLEEEALRRRERLKAMRKKSGGVPDEQVSEFINYWAFLSSRSMIGGVSQLQYLVKVEEDRVWAFMGIRFDPERVTSLFH